MKTKIKVKVDVMDVLKPIQKQCQDNDSCHECEFAFINKYDEVMCALSNTPMYWDLKKVGEKR